MDELVEHPLGCTLGLRQHPRMLRRNQRRRPPRLWMVTTGTTTVVVAIAVALLCIPPVSMVPVVTDTLAFTQAKAAAAAANPSRAPRNADTSSSTTASNHLPQQQPQQQPTPGGNAPSLPFNGTATTSSITDTNNNIPTTKSKLMLLNDVSSLPIKQKRPPGQDDDHNHNHVKEKLEKEEPPLSFGAAAQVHPHSNQITTDHFQQQQQQYEDFMIWCQRILGIQTSLEIHTFFYYDYMAVMTWSVANDDDDDDDHFFPTDNTNRVPHVEDFPMIPVRGLRATRDIEQGEIVISIPFQALLTVSTTIDQDPVLSRVMGPKARKAYGWTLESDDVYNKNNNEEHDSNSNNNTQTNNNNATPEDDPDEGPDFFELPLLAMALLHHRKLGTASPMHHYIEILTSSSIDSMPFLWNKLQRRQVPGSFPNNNDKIGGRHRLSEATQTVARSIRKEMKEMYHLVVDVLVTNHPELFGKEQPPGQLHEGGGMVDDEDWAFSFKNFQWAFAMVNSRHWQLPIEQKPPLPPQQPPQASPATKSQPQLPTPMSIGVDGVPPAEMPTDAWVEKLEEEEEEEHHRTTNNNIRDGYATQETLTTTYHSFLAPVADLLNFGPPCTRGRYNPETHTFDIIASCQFSKGQEVTFWYSDECEDIIVGNYGFTHPMVPKCPKADDYRENRDLWRRRAQSLQEELDNAYEDLDIIDSELQHVQRVLAGCDCCDTLAATEKDWRRQQEEQRFMEQEQQRRTQVEMDRDNLQQGQEQFHAKYLRKEDAHPSQIRGGSMTSSGGNSSVGGTTANSGRQGGNASINKGENRRSQRSDDDVERHGIRRKWMMSSAGRDRRSGL